MDTDKHRCKKKGNGKKMCRLRPASFLCPLITTRQPGLAIFLSFIFLAAAGTQIRAEEAPDVKALLARTVLAPQQTLTEVQDFCAARIPPLPAATTPAGWEPAADRLRQETLARTVYRGEAAKWRDAKLGLEWLETIAGGPGYRIRKLRYEALPGLWVPALLYEPENLSG